MKNIVVSLAAVSVAFAAVAPSAYAADANADAGAKIIAPLQISKSADLYFGSIAPSLTAADTVIVSPTGAKTCGSNLTCVTSDETAAGFNVTGEADASYTITLPTSITISDGGSNSMTVDTFTGSKANGTLTSGTDTFTVGGTLTVAANQAAGDYTGSFTVTVEYQ